MKKIEKILLYILYLILFNGIAIQYAKQIYQNYISDKLHEPFWFIGCSVSCLTIFLLLEVLIYILYRPNEIYQHLKYYALDLLILIFFYFIVCPVIVSDIWTLLEYGLYMGIAYIIVNIIQVIKQGYIWLHAGNLLVSCYALMLLYCFNPKIILWGSTPMEYPYIITAFVLIMFGTLIHTRENRKDDWLFFNIPLLLYLLLMLGNYIV